MARKRSVSVCIMESIRDFFKNPEKYFKVCLIIAINIIVLLVALGITFS